jgi:hypothetical protein
VSGYEFFSNQLLRAFGASSFSASDNKSKDVTKEDVGKFCKKTIVNPERRVGDFDFWNLNSCLIVRVVANELRWCSVLVVETGFSGTFSFIPPQTTHPSSFRK